MLHARGCWAGTRSASCHVERSRNICLFTRMADTACRVPTGGKSPLSSHTRAHTRTVHQSAHTNWPVLPTFSPCIQTCLHVKIAPAEHPGAHFAGLLNCYFPLMPRKNRHTNAIKLQKLLNIIMYIAFFNHYSYNFSTLRSTEKQRTGTTYGLFQRTKALSPILTLFNFYYIYLQALHHTHARRMRET